MGWVDGDVGGCGYMECPMQAHMCMHACIHTHVHMHVKHDKHGMPSWRWPFVITKYAIKLEQIKIIQFCLKICDP